MMRVFARTGFYLTAVLTAVVLTLLETQPESDYGADRVLAKPIVGNRPLWLGPIERSTESRVAELSPVTEPAPALVAAPIIHAAPGLTLTRVAEKNGKFLGYRVLSAPGSRQLSPGEIILEVNGIPVEDSAAGSELLLIALNAADATVTSLPADL